MHSKPPRVLYRYRAFDSRTLESLCRDELFFARPSSFNDPLDSKPTISGDCSIDTLRDLLKTLIERRIEGETRDSLGKARITGAKAEAYAVKCANEAAQSVLRRVAYNAENPEYEGKVEANERWLLASEISSELMINYDRGVCCFSSVYNSPLLWSHYGDQHRGICIGYDLDRQPVPLVHKAVYGGRRTVLTSTIYKALIEGDATAKADLDRDILLRKAPGWRYEREWRILGAHGLQDSCLRLKEVTFGLRCSDAVKHAVLCALEGRRDRTRFYEIREQHGSFRLRRSVPDFAELAAYIPRTAMSAEEMFPNDST